MLGLTAIAAIAACLCVPMDPNDEMIARGGPAGVNLSGYQCVPEVNCPLGPLYTVNALGLKVVGCTSTGGAACEGECKWCTGQTAPRVWCKKISNKTCTVVSSPTQTCGLVGVRDCFFSATVPIGHLPTYNSCYCQNGLTTPAGICDQVTCY